MSISRITLTRQKCYGQRGLEAIGRRSASAAYRITNKPRHNDLNRPIRVHCTTTISTQYFYTIFYTCISTIEYDHFLLSRGCCMRRLQGHIASLPRRFDGVRGVTALNATENMRRQRNYPQWLSRTSVFLTIIWCGWPIYFQTGALVM